jgi:DNA-binding NtrC family response regulator
MKSKTVFVDDQTNVLKRFSDVLFGRSPFSDRAGTAAKALGKMNRNHYDLVICNICDKKAAHEMLLEITSRFPATRTILLSSAGQNSQCLVKSGLANRILLAPAHKFVLRAAIAEQFRQTIRKIDPAEGMNGLAQDESIQSCRT